jgi:hypothetical protein
MASIAEFGKQFNKKAISAAIYKALGPDLTNELKHAGSVLTIDDDLDNYSFSNLTMELQEKIDLKKRP